MFRLQGGDDPECLYFQHVAEQGHYRGGPRGRSTRQGIYVFTPGGTVLAALNALDATRVAAALREAKRKWDALPAAERHAAPRWPAGTVKRVRHEDSRPSDGLVLAVLLRDLPTEGAGWPDRPRYNRDVAWFRAAEAKRFVPTRAEVGAEREVPRVLVERLARFHFLDAVRGQTQTFDPWDVATASMTTRVSYVEPERLHLVVTGETHAASTRIWRNYNRRHVATRQHEHGVHLRFHGEATVDRTTGRFVHFQVVGLGSRWGATLTNGRRGQPEPSPLGVLLTLGTDRPIDRIAPAFFQAYGWGDAGTGPALEPDAER